VVFENLQHFGIFKVSPEVSSWNLNLFLVDDFASSLIQIEIFISSDRI